MSTTSFNRYQAEAFRFAVYRHDLYPVLGLVEEAGEVAALFAKQLRKNGDLISLNYDKLEDELGDCLWMVAAIASEHGISLQRIAESNLEKLGRRKEMKELDSVERERD